MVLTESPNNHIVIIPNRPGTKRAGTETTVEQSLADLAFAQLSARAPRLLKYAVAFQILDQNKDRTKAVGIFGFKIGDKWLRVPVFYNKNEIGGTDLLMPTPDSFVPLNDQWVNLYVDGSAGSVGQPIDRATRNQGNASPSLWQFRTPPTKWASEIASPRVLRFLAEVKEGNFAKEASEPKSEFDLLDTCSRYPVLMSGLNKLAGKYSWFGDALVDHYGVEKVAAALRESEKPEFLKTETDADKDKNTTKKSPFKFKTKPKVTVIRVRSVTITHSPILGSIDFPPDDKETLRNGENVYRDRRSDDEITHVLDWAPLGDGTTTKNPNNGTGIYHVLMDDGNTEKCVVAFPVQSPKSDQGQNRAETVVIRLSDKATSVAHRSEVWVKQEEHKVAYEDFVDGLPEAGKPGALPDYFVLVSPTGEVSVPMKVSGTYAGGASVAQVSVWPNCCWPYSPGSEDDGKGKAHDSYCRKINWAEEKYKVPERTTAVPDTRDHPRIASTTANTDCFYSYNNTLYYPKGTKVITLKKNELALGDFDQATAAHHTYKEQRINVKKSNFETYVLSGTNTKQAHTAVGKDAEADLVEKFGLRPSDAAKLIKEAAKKDVTVRVKFAAPIGTTLDDGPNAPDVHQLDMFQMPNGYMDDVVPTRSNVSGAVSIADAIPGDNSSLYKAYPQEQGMANTDGMINKGDPQGPESDPDLMRQLAEASRSGRKDLFETTALLTLLKYTPIDTILTRCVVSLKKNINDMGKLLAHLQWNRDQWGEKFGRMEVGPLLDRIRDQFNNSGDIFLMLKERAGSSELEMGVVPDTDATDEGAEQ